MPCIILSGGNEIPITQKEYKFLIEQRFFDNIPRRIGNRDAPILIAGSHIAAILPTDSLKVKSAGSYKRKNNK